MAPKKKTIVPQEVVELRRSSLRARKGTSLSVPKKTPIAGSHSIQQQQTESVTPEADTAASIPVQPAQKGKKATALKTEEAKNNGTGPLADSMKGKVVDGNMTASASATSTPKGKKRAAPKTDEVEPNETNSPAGKKKSINTKTPPAKKQKTVSSAAEAGLGESSPPSAAQSSSDSTEAASAGTSSSADTTPLRRSARKMQQTYEELEAEATAHARQPDGSVDIMEQAGYLIEKECKLRLDRWKKLESVTGSFMFQMTQTTLDGVSNQAEKGRLEAEFKAAKKHWNKVRYVPRNQWSWPAFREAEARLGAAKTAKATYGRKPRKTAIRKPAVKKSGVASTSSSIAVGTDNTAVSNAPSGTPDAGMTSSIGGEAVARTVDISAVAGEPNARAEVSGREDNAVAAVEEVITSGQDEGVVGGEEQPL